MSQNDSNSSSFALDFSASFLNFSFFSSYSYKHNKIILDINEDIATLYLSENVIISLTRLIQVLQAMSVPMSVPKSSLTETITSLTISADLYSCRDFGAR